MFLDLIPWSGMVKSGYAILCKLSCIAFIASIVINFRPAAAGAALMIIHLIFPTTFYPYDSEENIYE